MLLRHNERTTMEDIKKAELMGISEDHLAAPDMLQGMPLSAERHKVGVVIVTHNASLAARVTLASLRRAKTTVPFEVVLVDNDSNQVERNALRRAFERHVRETALPWRYIQLEENRGFAGGANVGIEMFMEDPTVSHICLLNSDVIVTDFWLDRLIEKGVDIVSPVTNKADSVQWVPVDYELDLGACLNEATESIITHVFDTVNSFSQNWFRAWCGNIVPVEVTTFCCVLFTKDLIRRVGLLDTHFFPGGYEDDDYCARARALGVNIYLARDVFIHHWGSTSFGQLQREYFEENALRNRKYLEEKHKIIWKVRPQAPLLSFMQDVGYMSTERGEHSLQRYYIKLYLKALTKLLAHYEKEFVALQSLVRNCGRAVPQQLEQEIAYTAAKSSIARDWHDAVREISKKMKTLPWDRSWADIIAQKLAKLADAVYSIVTCNLKMNEFLSAPLYAHHSTKLASARTGFGKFLWMLRKGLAFFWRLRGIVIVGGYPYPEREKDGYFQRIRMVDSLLADRWRIYIETGMPPGHEGWYDRPMPNTLVLRITGDWKRKWFVYLCVMACVVRCRVIYFHSVLPIRNRLSRFLFRLPGVKKVVDLHGAVPEEFRYHEDFFKGWLYDQYEKLAVKKADYVIVVSEAMRRYCEQKWRGVVRCEFILLPNIPEIVKEPSEKAYPNGKPVVVYAGGLQKWQQVPKMIDAINKTADVCLHKFFCPQPEAVWEILPEGLRFHPHVIVDSKPHKELLQIYRECHYGFVLREDNVINRVACPTKLVEYIATGVVPIVEFDNIGDFKSLGMQFVRLQDFVSGYLPDEATRNRMAEENLAVYDKLRELYLAGAKNLQRALTVNRPSISNCLNHLIVYGLEWARRLLPSNTLRGRIVRRMYQSVKRFMRAAGLRPVAGMPHQAPVVKVKSDGIASLPPCDILVQVNNFIVGGLENVVLDLNEVLAEAGWRVGLLVLGEAGTAVEHARSKGMPVCVTRFEPRVYKRLLHDVHPKLLISHYSWQGASTCAELDIPLIQVIHNTYIWFSEDQVREFSETARYTTAFVAVSEFVKNYSVARLGIPPEKCLVIPNGIDLTKIKKMDFAGERDSLRAKYHFSNDDFVFLSVGSINHQKNHMGLVRAFRIALPDCPTAKLVVLGRIYEKELFAEIERYVKQRGLERAVFYVGETSNPYPYYAMADAFVGASFFEGGQLVLLEALAANLPVVTTEVGFAGIFKNRKGVALVPPPVDIFTYRGRIWELRSTHDFEAKLASQICRTYIERIRPDLPDSVVEMFDKRHSYKLYVSLVRQLFETGQISIETSLASWPALIVDPKNAQG